MGKKVLISVCVACLCLLLGTEASAGVSAYVFLNGPGSIWHSEDKTFYALPEYHLDEGTQKEVEAGKASVSTEFSWSWAPATRVAGGGEHDETITVRYAFEDGAAVRTLQVTYTVTVTFDGGGSTSANYTASFYCAVKRQELKEVGPGWGPSTGGVNNWAHQSMVWAKMTDGFDTPLTDYTLNFTLSDHSYIHQRAWLWSPTAVTNEDGVAYVMLTSCDERGTLQVQVSTPYQTKTASVEVSDPTEENLPKDEMVIGVGGLHYFTARIMHNGYAVPDHHLEWVLTEVDDEDGGAVAEGDWASYATVTPSRTTTDENGEMEAAFHAGSHAGFVVVEVRDQECHEADGSHVVLAQLMITIARFDHLEVSGAYRMGDTKQWAVGASTSGASVTVTAVMVPSVSPDMLGANELIWWSGEGQLTDLFHCSVPRITAGQYEVSASGAGGNDAVTIFVCVPTGIFVVSGAVQPEGTDDAVTEADPADTAGVTLEVALYPSLTIVPEPLLVWTGGATVAGHPERRWVEKSRPAKTRFACRCGDASVDKTLWVVRVDLVLAGVADAEEDTTPGSVLINSDDDNRNHTEDLQENPVPEENDLVGLLAVLQPSGLTLGQVALSAPPGGTALWKATDKSLVAPSSWNPPQLPQGLWIEGTAISGTVGDKSFTLSYTWGAFQTQDTVHLTVYPRPGASEAYLKLYRNLGQGEEAGSVVGGVLTPVLYLSIGPGERAKPEVVTVRVRDMYDAYEDVTDSERNREWTVDLGTASGWQVRQPDGTWVNAQEPPGGDEVNKSGGSPLVYRCILLAWNTMKEPLGNNGEHRLFTPTPVHFQRWVVGEGWTQEYANGAAPLAPWVENLHIENVTCSNGTIDYFKWDPEGGTGLQSPTLNFTIADADPHKYCCIVRYRQTAGSGTWDWDSGWSSIRHDLGTSRNAEIPLAASARTQDGLTDDSPWGTYTYDILVLEYDGTAPVWTQAAALDWNFLKRYREGYHLWVPECLPSPNQTQPGHDVWIEWPFDAAHELRAYYALENDRGYDAERAEITVLDSHLQERGTVRVPPSVGVAHGWADGDQDGEPDGILCHSFAKDDPLRDWRIVITARDKAGLHASGCRTHEPLPMLAVNKWASNQAINNYYTTIDETWGFRDDMLDKSWVEYCLWQKHNIPYFWRYLSVPIEVVGTQLKVGLSEEDARERFQPHAIVWATLPPGGVQAYQGIDLLGGLSPKGNGSCTTPHLCVISETITGPGQSYQLFAHVYFHELGHAIGLADEQYTSNAESNKCVMLDQAWEPWWWRKWGSRDPWKPHEVAHFTTAVRHLGGKYKGN